MKWQWLLMIWEYNLMRNKSWWFRAKRDWRKNGEHYMIMFVVSFILLAWSFAITVGGLR